MRDPQTDEPIGLLPDACQLREDRNEKTLSSNWVEYFPAPWSNQITLLVQDFRVNWGGPVRPNAAFGVANIGNLQNICRERGYHKIKIIRDRRDERPPNPSHCQIAGIPLNDMNASAAVSRAFDRVVKNSNVP